MTKKSLRLDVRTYTQELKDFLMNIDVITEHTADYARAFVHRSVLNEDLTPFTESNERLEYLWDAVLELIITERLYHSFPEKQEGELTDLRSAIVRGRNLASIAQKLEIGRFMLLSKGEILAGGKENPYLLANTVEALIGAMYLYDGLEMARHFIDTYIWSTLQSVLDERLYVDAKSHLQEITQSMEGVPPDYVLVSEEGAEHERIYRIEARLWEKVLGVGEGTSKKKAQQQAAEHALARQGEWRGIESINAQL